MSAVRYFWESVAVFLGWISGSIEPADAETQVHSPVVDILALTLGNGTARLGIVEAVFFHPLLGLCVSAK